MEHNFNDSLKEGKKGEAVLDIYFQGMGFTTSPASLPIERCGIDRTFLSPSGSKFTVEYKTDFHTARTGNAFIETISFDDGAKSIHGWALTSLAQVLVYYIPQEGMALWLNTLEIKKSLPEWRLKFEKRKISNGSYHGEGVLVPIYDFVQVTEKIYRDLPEIEK